jgi:ElaB/YqjD/DUF883 family membrane-anchored ribosome-binding protein
MTSSAKLQQQADEARAGLSTALDELRSSMTTAALSSGAMTLAKDGSSAVARAAIDKAMANPLGAMLIGAGLFMLMSTDKNGAADGAGSGTGNGVGKEAAGAAGAVGAKLRDVASSALGATRSAAGSAVDTAKSAADQVSSTAASAADRAKDALSKGRDQSTRSLHDAQDVVLQAKTRLEQFAAEQPILVAALGVAFGAAVGASLPVTAAERSFMGDASRKLAEGGTDVARKVADSVTGTLAGSDVAGKIGEVAASVTSTVKNSLSS